jgi:spindle assembly abnormal protein 6
LDVGEQDFHHLKRDQSLLVEFPVFPSKLIELIELCLSSNAEQVINTCSAGANDMNASSYSASLDMTTGCFSVIESNKFKQLTHISLQLRQGNDAAIKSYLSSRLAFVSTVATKKSADLERALLELSNQREVNTQVTKDLAELR